MPFLSTLGAATSKAWGFTENILTKIDAYAKYNTLLLNGDGVNGAQNNTFIDSSSNNISLTRNGNLTQGSFNPYGNLWSSYSPSGGSYFTAPNNAAFDFGSGNFTIEGWVNPPDSSQRNIVARDYTAGDGFILSSTNFLAAITTTWDVNITFSSGFTGGQWSHFAVVRNGNVWTCYINGVSVGTQTVSGSVIAGSDVLSIGNRNGQTPFAGYLSNFRIVKGTAVYISAFTPPTTPLTAISGTSILICQSNRFIDNSSNAFAITVNGSPSVQRFSPFNPTIAYDSTTLGASGYFNSSSYLSFNSSAAQVGSNDFTFETWFYPTDEGPYGGGGSLCCIGGDNNGYFGFNVGLYPAYGLSSGWSSGSGWYGPSSSVTSVKPFQWYHVAITRSSGNITMYLNGVSVGTGSFSNSKTGSENYIGYYTNHSSNYDSTFGYMAGWRLVIGSVLYSGNFTPPTTPPANVANTALLPKYNNAGIYGLAMMNDLQTIGSAQVSTSVKKYGTGSISFSGGSGDYLSNYSQQAINATNFGTGDFTVETWIYFNNTSGNQGIIDDASNPSSAGTQKWFINKDNSGNLNFGQHSVGNIISYNWNPSTGTWYHIAVTRTSGTLRMFINGNIVASTSNSTNFASSGGVQIGIVASYNSLNGYLDDLRITNGYARYTSNFIPPTAALTNY